MLPNVPPIFKEPLLEQVIDLRNKNYSLMYQLPEIYDSNNDTISFSFSKEIPSFIEYNYTENALVYNFITYAEQFSNDSIEMFEFDIILKDTKNAKNRYNLTV